MFIDKDCLFEFMGSIEVQVCVSKKPQPYNADFNLMFQNTPLR